MNNDEFLTTLHAALSQQVQVESLEGTFNVVLGQGPMARRANLDPAPLFEVLGDDPDSQRRQITGYADGVYHALLEPKRSPGPEMSFVEAASGLLPTIAAPEFALGVEAVAQETPWISPFAEGLNHYYLMHLNRGIRVLSAEQAQRWGVTADRITAAARSLLFHRTRDVPRKPFGDSSHVHRLHKGDGHDAARCQVIADVFYTEISSSFRFALPDADHLLFVYGDSPEELEALRQAIDEVYQESKAPLTKSIYHFDGSKPRPVT